MSAVVSVWRDALYGAQNDAMTKLEVVETPFVWPTQSWALAVVTERLDAIATRLGLPVWEWEEDGLGPFRGVAVRLPGGTVVALSQPWHELERSKFPGPAIEVDATEVAAHGVDAVLNDVLEALGIDGAAVHWKQTASTAEAVKAVEVFNRWRASHPERK